MNIIEVVPGKIYRGPQPVGPDWDELKRRYGISTVLKLNYRDEGSDVAAVCLGMVLMTCSMPPRDFVGSIGKPDSADVAWAVAALADEAHWPIYVHCTHGQDRTGLVVGEYRVSIQGWPLQKAWDEMRQYGFHPELLDLTLTWLEFCMTREGL